MARAVRSDYGAGGVRFSAPEIPVSAWCGDNKIFIPNNINANIGINIKKKVKLVIIIFICIFEVKTVVNMYNLT